MNIEINQIYNMDCLEGMKYIPDKSIDMILCDLPYGTTQNKWDSVIPFSELWNHYERLIKDNGVIILFGQGLFAYKLALSNEKLFKYDLVWKKGNRSTGFLDAKKRPLRNHELILIFYKRQPRYNPQFEIGQPLHGMGSKFKTKEGVNNNYGYFNKSDEKWDSRKGETKKYPKSILVFNKPHPPIHPTQKPVALFEYLIRTYTNEGDLVLDNCMGSGTTAIACMNTKRNFIGFELEKKYFDICIKRIAENKGVEP